MSGDLGVRRTRCDLPIYHRNQTHIEKHGFQILTGNIPYHHRFRDALIIRDMQNKIKPSGPQRFFLAGSDGALEDILEDHCWSFNPSERLHMPDIAFRIRELCDPYHDSSPDDNSPTSPVCYLKTYMKDNPHEYSY
jgi:hypothetical protein